MIPMSEHARTPAQPGPASAREVRFDALLEERFSGAKKREMAREMIEHDRRTGRAPQATPGVMPVASLLPPFDRDHVRRRIRFQGDVPEPLQKLLRAAIPELLAYAAEQGLRLRDLNHELHIMAKSAYEAETGKPLPAGQNLPAASYRYMPVSRIYQVRVVLPDQPTGTAQAAAILRVTMARLLGDIFLREEVFSRAAYQEDLAGASEISAALEDQILLLSGTGETSPELEQALAAHGKQIGMSYGRVPDKVRHAYFQDAARALAAQKLAPESESAIRAAVARFLERFRADLAAGLAQMIESVDKLNRQLNFLPPDETPEYLELKARNPRHYLRAAKLRLEHQLEVLGTALDAAEALEQPEGGFSPLLEEQIEGHLSELRRQNLARPYLVPGATLSDELEEKRAALPFEIHAILRRLPPTANPTQAFQAMQRRLSESLYQRLYGALLELKAWIRLREQGRAAEYLGGKRHRALKGQLSNFRFRLPLLRSMNARVGIVLDVLEASPEGGRALRFPVEPFARAWSHFVSYRVTGEALHRARSLLPRFDAPTYWRAMDEAVRQAVARGPGHFHVVHLLGRLRERAGDRGLRVLTDLLQQPPGTWRFVIHQALAEPPPGEPSEARLAQLDAWAELVLEARRRSLEHAILPAASG
jgi:hypothetical protein